MMRTSFLLSLMYLIIVGVSHSQTMKVVWEKQLAKNEKFLAVSRDGKLLLTYQAPILRLWDAQIKQEVSSLELKGPSEPFSADFSPSGEHILLNIVGYYYSYLKANPLKLIKNGYIINDYVGSNLWPTGGGVVGRFSDTSDQFAWIAASARFQGPKNTRADMGKLVYCDLLTGTLIREIKTSELSGHRFLSEGRATVVSSASNEAIIKKQDNPQFLRYKVAENVGCIGLYERYCICSTKIVDLVTGYETKSKYSNNIILLGEKEYIVEMSEDTLMSLTLRKISNTTLRFPIPHTDKLYKKLYESSQENTFLGLKSNNVLEYVRLEIPQIPDDKLKADFNVAGSRKFRTSDNIQFTNSSFPLLRNPLAFKWYFGDGDSSDLENPKHTYKKHGLYTVTLIVHSGTDIDTMRKSEYIQIVSLDTNIIKQTQIVPNLLRVNYSLNGKYIVCKSEKSTIFLNTQTLEPIKTVNGWAEVMTYKDKECIITLSEKTTGKLKIYTFENDSLIYTLDRFNIDEYHENTDILMSNINDSTFFYIKHRTTFLPDPNHTMMEVYNIGLLNLFNKDSTEGIKEFNPKIVYQNEIYDKSLSFNIYKKNIVALCVGGRFSVFDLFLGKDIVNEKNEPSEPVLLLDTSAVLFPSKIYSITLGKPVKKLQQKNILSYELLDDNKYLVATSDYYTPLMIMNISQDTLHLFRSTNEPQISLSHHPIHRNQFVSCDTKGTVNLWQVPDFKDKPSKLEYIDFTSKLVQNTVNLVSFTSSLIPSFAKAEYRWDFGDGTVSTERNPTHEYSTSGNFTIRLRVTVPNILDTTIEKKAFVTIDFSPISIDFYTYDIEQNRNYPINFINKTFPLHQKFTYKWDFGDGAISYDVNPTHTYVKDGKYTVKLTIARPGLNDTSITKKDYISIKRTLKITYVSQIPSRIFYNQPLSVQAIVQPTDANISVAWSVDDEIISTNLSAEFKFSQLSTIQQMLGVKRLMFQAKLDTFEYARIQHVYVMPKPRNRLLQRGVTLHTPFNLFLETYPLNGNYDYEVNWGDSSVTKHSGSSQQQVEHIYKSIGEYRVVVHTREIMRKSEVYDTLYTVVFPDNQRDFVNPTLSTGESIVMQTYGVDSKVSIFSMTGTLIRQWEYKGNALHEEIWNLEDENGNRIAAGMYYIVFKNENIQSSVIPVIIMY